MPDANQIVDNERKEVNERGFGDDERTQFDITHREDFATFIGGERAPRLRDQEMTDLQKRATNTKASTGYLGVEYNEYFEVAFTKAFGINAPGMMEKTVEELKPRIQAHKPIEWEAMLVGWAVNPMWAQGVATGIGVGVQSTSALGQIVEGTAKVSVNLVGAATTEFIKANWGAELALGGALIGAGVLGRVGLGQVGAYVGYGAGSSIPYLVGGAISSTEMFIDQPMDNGQKAFLFGALYLYHRNFYNTQQFFHR